MKTFGSKLVAICSLLILFSCEKPIEPKNELSIKINGNLITDYRVDHVKVTDLIDLTGKVLSVTLFIENDDTNFDDRLWIQVQAPELEGTHTYNGKQSPFGFTFINYLDQNSVGVPNDFVTSRCDTVSAGFCTISRYLLPIDDQKEIISLNFMADVCTRDGDQVYIEGSIIDHEIVD